MALHPALLRALSMLRWLQVYLYWGSLDRLPPSTRLAITTLTHVTDELVRACNFAPAAVTSAQASQASSAAPPSLGPDWRALASDELASCYRWLVACVLFLGATLPPGPLEVRTAGARK